MDHRDRVVVTDWWELPSNSLDNLQITPLDILSFKDLVKTYPQGRLEIRINDELIRFIMRILLKYELRVRDLEISGVPSGVPKFVPSSDTKVVAVYVDEYVPLPQPQAKGSDSISKSLPENMLIDEILKGLTPSESSKHRIILNFILLSY